MPLQNRVTPWGEIVATPERGLFMGNRGMLHDAGKQLRRRRWALKAWLICRLDFKGRRREVMAPRRYTELFFFDEAAALAAGHRPCYECRRADFRAWQAAWRRAKALPGPPRAPEMDTVLHAERIEPGSRKQRRWRTALGELPAGTFIDIDGAAYLVAGDGVRAWSWRGYGPAEVRPAAAPVTVLTPPSSVAALRAGYAPLLHPSVTNSAI